MSETNGKKNGKKWAELTPRARERFLSNWSDDSCCESTLEYYKKGGEIQKRGFDVHDIDYSVGHCRSDGAAWVGRAYIKPLLDTVLPGDENAVKREILRAMIDNDDMISHGVVRRTGHRSYGMEVVYIETYFGTDTVIDAKNLKDSLFYGAHVGTLFDAIGGEDFITALECLLLEQAKALAAEMYEDLQADWEYAHSEENIAELAEANEWTFSEDGHLL